MARGEVEAYRDILVVWLKAACTARGGGGGGAQNGVPIVYHPIQSVHLPGDVYRYMITKVCADLSAVAAPDPMTARVTGSEYFGPSREAETRKGPTSVLRASPNPFKRSTKRLIERDCISAM